MMNDNNNLHDENRNTDRVGSQSDGNQDDVTIDLSKVADEDDATHQESSTRTGNDTETIGHNAQMNAVNDIPLYTKAAPDTQEHDAYGNTIVRKTGASTPTIVFGSILIVCGILATLAAMYWTPENLLASMNIDWRIMLAIALAAIGGILLLSSLFWTISTLLHRMKR
ncbi:hypothetical protein [Bifidobacterium aquikefiri]|uniref:hypothetical protein n=1 Tax=Bifidobacterium aquikefiri TaxID=1653207 RepID=UPI0039E91E6F